MAATPVNTPEYDAVVQMQDLSLHYGKTVGIDRLTLDIPAGADNGSYIKKSGFGEASKNGGPSGDLIVVIKVEPSKIFKRKNFDLYVELPISFKTAVLGGKVKIPLIDETMEYLSSQPTQTIP